MTRIEFVTEGAELTVVKPLSHSARDTRSLMTLALEELETQHDITWLSSDKQRAELEIAEPT